MFNLAACFSYFFGIFCDNVPAGCPLFPGKSAKNESGWKAAAVADMVDAEFVMLQEVAGTSNASLKNVACRCFSKCLVDNLEIIGLYEHCRQVIDAKILTKMVIDMLDGVGDRSQPIEVMFKGVLVFGVRLCIQWNKALPTSESAKKLADGGSRSINSSQSSTSLDSDAKEWAVGKFPWTIHRVVRPIQSL